MPYPQLTSFLNYFSKLKGKTVNLISTVISHLTECLFPHLPTADHLFSLPPCLRFSFSVVCLHVYSLYWIFPLDLYINFPSDIGSSISITSQEELCVFQNPGNNHLSGFFVDCLFTDSQPPTIIYSLNQY